MKVMCVRLGVVGSDQTWCGRHDATALASSDHTIPDGVVPCPLCRAQIDDFESEAPTGVRDAVKP
jgi:hypothetical protein